MIHNFLLPNRPGLILTIRDNVVIELDLTSVFTGIIVATSLLTSEVM